jgi:hypothetical protein
MRPPSRVSEHIQRAILAGLRAKSAMAASHVETATTCRNRALIAPQAGVSAKLPIVVSNSHQPTPMSCS